LVKEKKKEVPGFLSQFFVIEHLANFPSAKLVGFILGKNNFPKYSQFVRRKIDKISWKTISAYDLHINILQKAWTV
jgi:hypothetical protein